MTGRGTRRAVFFCFLATLLVLWAAQEICAKKKPPLHPVNLNTASAAQLQEVPGIGPSTAERILQARKSYGRFRSVDDLQSIKGIGPKRLEKMRKYLTVGQPPLQTGKQIAHAGARAPVPKSMSEKAQPSAQPPSPSTSDEEEQ